MPFILGLHFCFVGVSSGRLQQLASAALMDVAASGSGKEGYARASEDEIDSLLSALQNQDTTVRDAALRVIPNLNLLKIVCCLLY